ncbi:MAG: winged helix-turn-helix domain-containing protein [Solirubrobacteraceae bacterium]
MTTDDNLSPKPRRFSRSQASVTHGRVLEADGVVLDGLRRRVQVDGYIVYLPAREAAVLSVLMSRSGQVVHRTALVDAAWGAHRAPHGAVDRLLRRLRRRIELSPLSPARLHRVGDNGYIFGSCPNCGCHSNLREG